MDIKNIVIGLPETGKTTFLAALWHVVTSREISGSLTLNEYPPERGYIEKLVRKWLDLESVGRTSQESINQIVMKLTSPADNATEEIVFPDVSGELYRDEILKGRICSPASYALFQKASNILLFVNPNRIQGPDRIDEVGSKGSSSTPKSSSLAELDALLAPSANAATESTPIPWEPDLVPTQVKMVELLQLIASICENKFGIAVVVSAWDRIPQPCTPSEWLRKELPLLHQFLMANSGEYRCKFFGVSAFGGDPEKDVSALGRKHTRPSDRIIVHEDHGTPHHDITAPIRWLIFKDAAN
ncbi:MAG: hypothetical protein SF051_04500 [Elusimicrobiota bacterium]|nr:hypothetical protein [Elusimicrobiota bacterium]